MDERYGTDRSQRIGDEEWSADAVSRGAALLCRTEPSPWLAPAPTLPPASTNTHAYAARCCARTPQHRERLIEIRDNLLARIAVLLSYVLRPSR